MRAALALALTVAACGPIEYVNTVTRQASASVDAAREVAVDDDPEYTYWFTLAEQYLRRARVEAAQADYQAANRFGRKAKFAAEKAREIALARASGQRPAAPPPPDDDSDDVDDDVEPPPGGVLGDPYEEDDE